MYLSVTLWSRTNVLKCCYILANSQFYECLSKSLADLLVFGKYYDIIYNIYYIIRNTLCP